MRRLVSLFVFLGSTLCLAQSWHEPYDTKTSHFTPDSQSVGYLLEPIFTNVLDQCGVGDFKSLKETHFFRGDTPTPKSAIPPQLQKSPGLDLSQHWKASYDNESVGQTFAYLYTENDLQDLAHVVFNHSRMLKLDKNPAANDPEYGVVPSSFLPSAVFDAQHNFVYTSACDSILSAAANQKSGVTLPAASFQESFAGSYNLQNKDTLVLVRGENFYSPIGYMLDTPAWSGYAKLLIWSLYGRPANVGMSAQKNYYLHDAPALAIVQTSRQTRDLSAELKLGASGALPYLTVDSSFRAALSSSNTASFTVSKTVLLDSPSNPAQPVLAPSPAAIASSFANVLQLKTAPIFKRGSNDLTALAPGVPAFLCRSGLWSVGLDQPAVTGAALSFNGEPTSTPAEIATDPPNCVFNLRLTIPNSVDVSATPSFSAVIAITLAQRLNDIDGKSYQLVLKGGSGDISLSGSPIVNLNTPFLKIFVPTGNPVRPYEHDLVWLRDIQITDDAVDPIDVSRGVSVDAGSEMRCKDVIQNFSVDIQTQPGAQNPHTFTVRATRAVVDPTNLDLSGNANSLNLEDCNISATARFYMATGRPFAVRITDWSVRGPTAPAPITPAPAPTPAPTPTPQH